MSNKQAGRRKVVLRVLLAVTTLIIIGALGLWMFCGLVFNGPSKTAGDALARKLTAQGWGWVLELFLDDTRLAQLDAPQQPVQQPSTTEPVTEPTEAPTQPFVEEAPTAPVETVVEYAQELPDEWADCPDGVRLETVYGRTYTAHVMLIKDPSQVYLATSSDRFSKNVTGGRIVAQMETEGAIAAINGGAFNDDGTAGDHVGSLPIGIVISDGQVLWDDGKSYNGFVGLTRDNKLVVSDTISRTKAEELGIRDGCCFGPVLIRDGQTNENVRDMNVDYNARTAIGQRADGTVIFACLDGRQAGSLGATYADSMELMQRLGAVNACNLDGGASTVMTYRDVDGRFGTPGETVVCNSYALIQANPRRMPTFFMVRPAEEG